MLKLAKSKDQYAVNTTDYEKQLPCVLLQKQENGSNHHAKYWYHIVNYKEHNLATGRRKRLTVVLAILLLRLYL